MACAKAQMESYMAVRVASCEVPFTDVIVAQDPIKGAK